MLGAWAAVSTDLRTRAAKRPPLLPSNASKSRTAASRAPRNCVQSASSSPCGAIGDAEGIFAATSGSVSARASARERSGQAVLAAGRPRPDRGKAFEPRLLLPAPRLLELVLAQAKLLAHFAEFAFHRPCLARRMRRQQQRAMNQKKPGGDRTAHDRAPRHIFRRGRDDCSGFRGVAQPATRIGA
jgi:hypothetical protein